MNLPGRAVTMARWPFACAMLIVMTRAGYAEPDPRDLFKLCPPDERMRLIVERRDEHATNANLAEAQIRNAAESRLRAAGLYDPDADPYLYVNVNAGPPKTGSRHFPFFSIELAYYRLLLDRRILSIVEHQRPPPLDFARSLYGLAATWRIGSAGQGDSSFILSSLSQDLDKFLVEYLRVRDSKACRELRAKDGG